MVMCLKFRRKCSTMGKCALLLVTVVTPCLILSIGRSKDTGGAAVYRASNSGSRGLLLATPSIQRNPDIAPADNSGVRERFAGRRQHLLQQCSHIKNYYSPQNSENAVKEHLTISKEHKLVYCAIEKVGCTFWKRVFQILCGFKNVTDPFQIQAIRAYEGYLTAKGLSFDMIHMILKTSSKFMFVREPYERLLSGYVDKLFAPNAVYWNFIGTHIVDTFRKNGTNQRSKTCGHDITFEEFVNYFLHSQVSNVRRDAHFVPNFEHCRPCELDYDYIGKLETFEEDTLFLLKALKIDGKIKFKNFQKEAETDAISDAVDYVYSMKREIIKCMTLPEALLRCYRKLQIRGIISKEIPFPLPLDSLKEITHPEFKQVLLDVHARSGSPASRKSNRKEAFIEAYATLPPDLMSRLQNILSVDAQLFGYEAFPKILQDMHSYKPDFKYFQF